MKYLNNHSILMLGFCWLILFTNLYASKNNQTMPEKISVVVWDERQDKQKEAYDNYLGNYIADYLRGIEGVSVMSVALDDPEQGIADEILNQCDVLIWWGHVRHGEINREKGQKIVQRIKEGKLSLIALHAAHWSTPFVEAMNERTRMDVISSFAEVINDNMSFNFIYPEELYNAPKSNQIVTPYTYPRKYPDGKIVINVHYPICCFPAYRPDAKPSYIKTMHPDHPLAKGIPEEFKISQTEMYDEPFHIPDPDLVIFEERWPTGEWFRSGSVWNIGKGKVFYFRPGHELYPVYKDKTVLKIIENAVRWLGKTSL
jgi:trehalose utilization protein